VGETVEHVGGWECMWPTREVRHHNFVAMKEMRGGMSLPLSLSSDEGERMREPCICVGGCVRPVKNISSVG